MRYAEILHLKMPLKQTYCDTVKLSGNGIDGGERSHQGSFFFLLLEGNAEDAGGEDSSGNIFGDSSSAVNRFREDLVKVT